MMRRPAISRADLVACYRQDPDCLDHCAALFGFERRPRVQVPEALEAEATAKVVMKPAAAEPTDLTDRATLWQHTRTEPHYVPASASPAPDRETPRTVAEVLAHLRVPPPEHRAGPSPLIPWNKLWPFARAALGTVVPSDRIDVDALVRQVSKGETIRSIPRKPKQTWAGQAQLIIDRDRRLLPFWDDQLEFIRRLCRWRGRLGLDVLIMHDGPDGAVRRFGRGGEPYGPPSPDVPILVLSDLGCLDVEGGVGHDWSRFGRALVATGHRLVALSPCSRRRWRAPLDRVWRLACWDGGQPLPSLKAGVTRGLRRLSAPDPAASQRALDRLLGCLSVLINVEPALLRALRRLLTDPACDVGTEAEAWCHADVHGGSLTVMGLKRDAPVRAVHRQVFEREPRSVQEGVLALARAHHDGKDKRAFLLEECCHLADLGVVPRKLTRAARTLFRQLSHYLDRQDVRETEDPEPVWVAGWVVRAVMRLPPRVRAWAEVSDCWRLADELLRRRAPRPSDEIPEGVAAWPVAPIRRHDLSGSWWYVWQRGATVGVVPAEPDSSPPAGRLGALVASIRALSPQFEVICEPAEADARRRGTARFFLRGSSEQQTASPIGDPARIVVASDRHELHLTPVDRGSWDRMGRDRYGLYAEFDLAGVTHRMRWIGPGTFMMGSPEDEPGRWADESLHQVTLTRGFWLAETACSQEAWKAVTGRNPSQSKGEQRPVEQVSWKDCQGFLKRANAAFSGGGLRLPTEAEWEYACRAGTTTRFWFGDEITTEQVNHGPERSETVDVKALPRNAWGLYQMHGNVFEWCEDWFGDYPAGPVDNPRGAEEGANRVVRGGSWIVEPRICRSACRVALHPGGRNEDVGFRLARGQ